MGALRFFGSVLAAAAASAASAQPISRWDPYIAEASSRYGIPETWIRRVMRAESGGRTTLRGRPIVSPKGALGLMQVMPDTWREVRAAEGLGLNPHDPHDNILAGTAYLRRMYDRFGYPGLFSAYNAGPARYADHVASGRRLPAETVAYLAVVAGRGPIQPASSRGAGTPPSLFVIRVSQARPTVYTLSAPAAPASDSQPASGRLFAVIASGQSR